MVSDAGKTTSLTVVAGEQNKLMSEKLLLFLSSAQIFWSLTFYLSLAPVFFQYGSCKTLCVCMA